MAPTRSSSRKNSKASAGKGQGLGRPTQSGAKSSTGKNKNKEDKEETLTLEGSDLAEYLAFQQSQLKRGKNKSKQGGDAQKEAQAQKEALDRQIQSRNDRLMQQEEYEEGDNSLNNLPTSSSITAREKEPSHSSQSPGLDEEERRIAEDFEAYRQHHSEEEEQDFTQPGGEAEGGEEETEQPEHALGDNGMDISPDISRSSMTPFSHHSSSTSSQQKKKTFKSSGSNKITRDDFSHSLRLLGDEAKKYLRFNLIFDAGILDPDMGKEDWIWKAVTEAVKKSSDSQKSVLQKGLEEATVYVEEREKLLTYVSYAKGYLFNIIVGKARSKVVGHYGLTGSKDDIKLKVEWLLLKAKFIYGDIDYEKKTYDRAKPFGNTIFKEVIRAIWFVPKTRGDTLSTSQMIKDGHLPLSVILFAVTAVEHALGEYKAGSELAFPFRENIMKSRYVHHMKSWNALVKKSENWGKYFLKKVFDIIINSSNLQSLLLDAEGGGSDVEDIDAELLNSTVTMGGSVM